MYPDVKDAEAFAGTAKFHSALEVESFHDRNGGSHTIVRTECN